MQVKNKIFPYPIINNNKNYSNFNELAFDLIYEPEETKNAYILKNTRFFTESKTILKLIKEGKIGITVVVESSNSVYRKSFEITEETKDITLFKSEFLERVDISMFAYAKKDFIFQSDEVDEDYLGISFNIDKYDIVGVNDGFNIRFKHNDEEDNLIHSIFSINVGHNLEEGEYLVEFDIGRKISINLPENEYKNYKIIYTVPVYKEVFFNMLLIPALIEGLSLCKAMLDDPSKDLEDVGNHYLWFRSILTSYKRLEGKELTIETFKGCSLSSLSQKLLGKPLGEALKKLVSETNNLQEEEV